MSLERVRRVRLAVILASYNRCDITLACLGGLTGQRDLDFCELKIIVVDDGSSDGTAQSVRRHYPGVELLSGDGCLYWNGAMRVGLRRAMEWGADGYLWLNDDVRLQRNALSRAIACWQQYAGNLPCGGIFVGATFSTAGDTTYGGYRQTSRLNPLKLSLLSPGPAPDGRCQACDTFNGNFVLVTHRAAMLLGNLDQAFSHAGGDTDYGLRAHQMGVPVLLMPGYFGECERNSDEGTWRDVTLPLRVRWRLMREPKGLPVRDWYSICNRHGGSLRYLLFLFPYAKFWLVGLVERVQR